MSSSLTERDDDGCGGVVMGAVDEDLTAASAVATAEDGDDDDDSKTIRGGDDTDDQEVFVDASSTIGDGESIRSNGSLGNGGNGGNGGEDGGEDGRENGGENGSNGNDRNEHEHAHENGNTPALASRYRELLQDHTPDTASEDGSALGLPRRPGSPSGSVVSLADSTMTTSTAQRSGVSSIVGSSVFPSSSSTRSGLRSSSPSFRPFDRRFQSRIASPMGSLASSGLLSPRPSSPSLLSINTHSRSGSTLSQFRLLEAGGSGVDAQMSSPPWEVVRWTKLMKLSNQAFSESAKRNFGTPTCMTISASLVLGTTKGILLVFDYNQNLKMIIGPGTRAVESGAITSLAMSADHTTVAGGHADGSIFTWEISRAARPFLHIPPLAGKQAEPQLRTMDGHVFGFAVTHLGFLGTRRTALVSADDRGMAFSHLATRGTGSLGRTVKTSRILGRYPGSKPLASGKPTKPIKPSTVLAFAPLPLGNVERATDTMGLTAMLTPYLLVIVSTTPVANTQHKSPRPREVAPHSAMSGCLAWFPAVRLKMADARTGVDLSPAKLVYCWSNVLTVLDVEEEAAEDAGKPPNLHCRARSRWKCEEAVVAVQWLTRSVLAVLTVSQRLIVLEDHSMRVTEAFDLMDRYIFHADLFSRQLQGVVETLDEDDTSLHGVVADAFFMSFKAYKGRLFLLGFSDMAIGALSNWADRLLALMEHGDYVGAIQLATTFYTGDADKLTIGLPEDTATRHGMVRTRLMEMMGGALKKALGEQQEGQEQQTELAELAQTCFAACVGMEETDFVWEDMFEGFEEAGREGVFLETLEPYILEQTITTMPPTVVKALVRHYVSRGLESRLEEMICNMETAMLDLDEVTGLCKQHGLYDALIYVWNQAMGDFLTPLVELLALLVPRDDGREDEVDETNAVKMFPYLSYVLTGRVYPTGAAMDEATQQVAKSEVYWFLFSGKSLPWPRGGSRGQSRPFRTRPEAAEEPTFPYLRMILEFDAPSLLSALNEAFEDSFLNESPEKQLASASRGKLPEEQVFGLTVSRQYIVSILTEVLVTGGAFAAADTVYLDMFIARNVPKYPQYLLLPESTLTRVLSGLCRYPGADLAEDAQLSAEYLLSVYQPPEMASLIPLFRDAGFFRILKRSYRADHQYAQLLQTYFEDPDDRAGIFACMAECLRGCRPSAHAENPNALRRQAHEVRQVLRDHARVLVALDAAATARGLADHAAELHQPMLDAVDDRHDLQYAYLGALLEGSPASQSAGAGANPPRDLVEQYVRLMCEFAPTHVSDYVGLVQVATDLRLDELLPTMEQTGVVDAAVVLMAREGQVQQAMDRLVQHLRTLEAAVEGVLADESQPAPSLTLGTETPRSAVSNVTVIQRNAAEDLMRALQKYTHVGIWLCQGQTRTRTKTQTQQTQRDTKVDASPDEALPPDERLWLDLIDTTVQITCRLSAHMKTEETNLSAAQETEEARLVGLLRSLVQHTFTALLTTTAAAAQPSALSPSPSPSPSPPPTSNLSFLRILKAFLVRAAASSPSLADLRAVLASIFSAYAYEESILRLANRLLDRSLFVSVHRSVELRQRGWRAKGSVCEACGRRVWGPGVGASGVYEAWEAREAATSLRRSERNAARRLASGAVLDRGKGKAKASEEGKGKATGLVSLTTEAGEVSEPPEAIPAVDAPTPAVQKGRLTAPPATLGPLVLFGCRHIFHQTCLDTLETARRAHGHGQGHAPEREREYTCPIDG